MQGMTTAILEQRARIGKDGTLLLHLPPGVWGQEVDVQLRPYVPVSETELIVAINRPLAAPVRSRYNTLAAKRDAETLTAEEYEELQSLTDAVEADHLERWESIARLAVLRGEAVRAVAAGFGLVLTL